MNVYREPATGNSPLQALFKITNKKITSRVSQSEVVADVSRGPRKIFGGNVQPVPFDRSFHKFTRLNEHEYKQRPWLNQVVLPQQDSVKSRHRYHPHPVVYRLLGHRQVNRYNYVEVKNTAIVGEDPQSSDEGVQAYLKYREDSEPKRRDPKKTPFVFDAMLNLMRMCFLVCGKYQRMKTSAYNPLPNRLTGGVVDMDFTRDGDVSSCMRDCGSNANRMFNRLLHVTQDADLEGCLEELDFTLEESELE